MPFAKLRHKKDRIIGEVMRQLAKTNAGPPYSAREIREEATDELIDLYVKDARLAGCSSRADRMSFASREFMTRHPGYSPIQMHKQLEMVAFI